MSNRLDPTLEMYGDLREAYDFYNRALFDNTLPGAMLTVDGNKARIGGYFAAGEYGKDQSIEADTIALNPRLFTCHTIEHTLSIMVHEQCHQWQHHFGDAPDRPYHNKEYANAMLDRGLMTSSTGRPGGRSCGEKMSHYILTGEAFDTLTKEFITQGFKLRWYNRYPSKTTLQPTPRFSRETKRDEAIKLLDQQRETLRSLRDAPDGIDSELVERIDLGKFIDGATSYEPPETNREDKSDTDKKPQKNKVKYTCNGCSTNVWGKPSLRIQCLDCYQPFHMVG